MNVSFSFVSVTKFQVRYRNIVIETMTHLNSLIERSQETMLSLLIVSMLEVQCVTERFARIFQLCHCEAVFSLETR